MSHDLHNTPSLASEYDEQPQLLRDGLQNLRG